MNPRRWMLIGGIGVLLALAAVMGWRTLRDPDRLATGAPAGPKPQRASARPAAITHWEPYSPLVDTPDPTGSLRLEGQVIDGQDHAVNKAAVTINSSPPRTVVTEEDGAFVFERLIPRQYKLRARAGALVGGPIKHQLKAGSEPLIIRMRPGVALEVQVVAATDRRPIAGARVAVDQEQRSTNSEGKAVFEGTPSGFVVVAARADGYGVAQRLLEVALQGQQRMSTTIALSRGAAVSGVVSDHKGAPVAGATVQALNMAQLVLRGSSPLGQVETDERGRYAIAGLAAGTYRVIALKAGFAPAQSAPLAVDGEHPRDGVTITLEAGATLAGRVLDRQKGPVASATVKVLLKGGSFAATPSRQRRAVTDQDGGFKLGGLPRQALEAMAFSEQASSEVQAFDLSKGDVDDATLQLTVSGQIAGTVVDGAGEPVAEVQVTAVGDFWGGAKVADLKLRGTAEVMTDGGGGFRFGGLPEGKYRLRASRTARLESKLGPGSVPAQTGDTKVKIVLRANGGAKGVLRFADGRPATAYTVNVGHPPAVPVVSGSGAFELTNLRAGKYDVTFSSAAFTDKTVRDVEIAPDRVTDMGSITVDRGRAVKGRVLDAKGRPVAGALVVLGSKLVGDGANLALELGASVDQSLGLRRAATKEDGTFLIGAVGAGAFVVGAEHAVHGRSSAIPVPAGEKDAEVELRLRPCGSVTGTVKLGDAPGANVTVVASAGDSKQVVLVKSGDDGRFAFERLPAGKQTLTAIAGQGAGASTGASDVVVAAGKTTPVEIKIDVGEIDLSLTVVAQDGTINATQIFLFSGQVNASSGAEINQLFLAASKKGTAKMAFAAGGKQATIAKIRPGAYSVCSIPITGNMNDPIFAKRLQAHAAKLKVYCQAHTVPPSPTKQSLTLTLPAMEPLPQGE